MADAEFDFLVIGGGSAGCTVAAGLVEREVGSVALIEAGPSDNAWRVKAPLGLVWLMGSKRDWRYRSSPQAALGGRRLNVPRGRMLGGSASINSMVWFRGRRDDFDGWDIDGWRWDDVAPAFEAIEAVMTPAPMRGPHPLSHAFPYLFGGNGGGELTPEYESGGLFRYNMRNGRRWSPADAFVRPAVVKGLTVLTGTPVSRLLWKRDRAAGVRLADGSEIRARKGVVLSAGAIASPELLMRSGVGPADDLRLAGIEVTVANDQVGKNLHDHPAAGIWYKGKASGYGLEAEQLFDWLSAPFRYLANASGPIASPTVEAGAFFSARENGGPPDIQVHFIPFMLGWKGRRIVGGSGYFADVCVCRPKSRGELRFGLEGLEIDLGLFNDRGDLELLTDGWLRLRRIMAEARFGERRAPEAYPGPAVVSRDDARAHVLNVAATAYHPVGTLRMGEGDAPVTSRLGLRGIDGLWVADASIMPSITSANTNAPSIMIGHRAAQFIAEDGV